MYDPTVQRVTRLYQGTVSETKAVVEVGNYFEIGKDRDFVQRIVPLLPYEFNYVIASIKRNRYFLCKVSHVCSQVPSTHVLIDQKGNIYIYIYIMFLTQSIGMYVEHAFCQFASSYFRTVQAFVTSVSGSPAPSPPTAPRTSPVVPTSVHFSALVAERGFRVWWCFTADTPIADNNRQCSVTQQE